MSKMMLTCALIGAAGLASAASAQTTLAEWTFETSPPTNAGPHAAASGFYQAISQATGSHVSGATVYDNPAGNGSNESFSSNNWAVGDYYQFKSSASAYQDLTFTWDQVSSGTGPKDWTLSASTDGINFSIVTIYSVLANNSPDNWSATLYKAQHTRTVALPANLNSAPTIYVRLTQLTTVSANNGTVASGGTSRVDNVKFEGEDKIPAPGAAALLGLGGLLASRRRRA